MIWHYCSAHNLSILLSTTLLLAQGACAVEPPANTSEGRAVSWVEFVAPFEMFFNHKKEHFKIIADELIDRDIYRLNTGLNNLLIQQAEGDQRSPAPDALSQKLLPHFKAINLLGISVSGGVIQMGAMGGFPEFNGTTAVLTIDYLRDGRKNEILCEENTIESTPEGGYCLWPLGEPNWFAKFIWVDQRDKSIWP